MVLPRRHGEADGWWRYDVDGDGHTICDVRLGHDGHRDSVANAMVAFDISADVHYVVDNDDRYDDSKRRTRDPALCAGPTPQTCPPGANRSRGSLYCRLSSRLDLV